MNILICLIIIAVTGILLMKRYQPQPILIGMGILMMYIAYEGSWINAILDESQSTGVLVFDAMDIVRILLLCNGKHTVNQRLHWLLPGAGCQC